MHAPLREPSFATLELNDSQEHILGQCALFQQSFTHEAAQAILRLPNDTCEDWALDVVQSLVDLDLLTRAEAVPHHWRYHVASAAERRAQQATLRLSPVVRVDFRDLHANYYCALGCEARMNTLSTHGSLRSTKLLVLERANLDAAMAHALATDDGHAASGAFMALSALNHLDGFSHDIVVLAQRVLACPDVSVRQQTRVLLEYAEALRVDICTARSREASEKALALAEKLADDRLVGFAKRELAVLADQEGHPNTALPLFQEAIAIHRRVGNQVQEALDTDYLGRLYVNLGRVEDARACYEQSIVLHREVGNELALAATLGNLAVVCEEAGEIEDAKELFEEAIAAHEGTGSKHEECFVMGSLGELYLRSGRLLEARDHLEASVALSEEVGETIVEAVFRGALAELNVREGKLKEARHCVTRAEQILRAAHDPQDLAKVLCRRGFMEAAQGDENLARQSLAEALALATQTHAGRRTTLRHLCDDLQALLDEGRPLGSKRAELQLN